NQAGLRLNGTDQLLVCADNINLLHLNAGQNHDIQIANRSFQKFRYLRRTVTYQNLIYEEVKRRLNSDICWYCSVQRDKITGSWRKLRNKEFHSLCSSPNII
ncbi:hypothetical protein B7P43_G11330, partial [Cryptotermes secundus]